MLELGLQFRLDFLFPELERSMRDTDFLHQVRSDDSMAFRATVPLDIKQSDFRPAADGQMGCILKLYREWQISGDDVFLKKMWPNAKRASSQYVRSSGPRCAMVSTSRSNDGGSGAPSSYR